MPEVAVDEHDEPGAPKDHVGSAGQVSDVFPESKTKTMEATSQDTLGSSVGGPDAGHEATTLLARENVCHARLRYWQVPMLGVPLRYDGGSTPPALPSPAGSLSPWGNRLGVW
jgi:hypothetical protein